MTCAGLAVVGLLIGVSATGAAAAALPKGTVHVVYIANTNVEQTQTPPGIDSTQATEKLSWNVSADISLAGRSNVPYRYSKNFAGTVGGDGTSVHGPINCSGKLSIASSNAEDTGTFQLELAKSGTKATLGAASPVPVYTGDYGQFGADAGPNCQGSTVLAQIENRPAPTGPRPILVKLDLAKLAKAKGKTQTFKVGQSDNVTHGTTTTKYDWNGTITLTLTK